MSFLKKLFGGGGDAGGSAPAAEATEYEGFTIVPAPQKEGGQYRLAGTISKTVDGEDKSHRLIRADLFQSSDEAVDATVRKAKQVIDEQGDALFGRS